MANEKEKIEQVLERMNVPTDVQALGAEERGILADEIRKLIIEVVSRNGGHLAPSLGVVELTIALLSVFDPAEDRIIWDVGHQAYGYKILTDRRDRFPTLRTLGGVSGFPKRGESPYDHFGVGHSSTSISAALGMADGRDLAGRDNKVVAVIGDGSMTAGLAYEGLNQAGGRGSDLIVVLNDNEMSISKNVGALSSFLSRQLTGPLWTRFKRDVETVLKRIPNIGGELLNYARKSEESFKHFFTPGILFEAFKFDYLGPFDGHNQEALIEVFKHARRMEGSVLIHVLTKKGRGYEPAETNPTYFHGVGCFEPETGEAKKFGACELPSYTKVFGETLIKLAEKDERIVAITAAMPEGTGLTVFADRFPERFVDVGICEQHAVTYAAGMATEGYKPVVAIYSTFMQRSYDQVVHDVCLQNLPVTFCLDRGGLVGEDGPTHHGAFDLSFMRHIPNMTLMAPKDEAELQRMLATCLALDGPAAVRYPRGVGVGTPLLDDPEPFDLGEAELLKDGSDIAVLAVGSRVYPALEAARELGRQEGLSVAVLNARFVKPLAEAQILELARKTGRLLLVEENILAGGFGSAVLELLADNGALGGLEVRRVGLKDCFVEHGGQRELRAKHGIDKHGIAKVLADMAGLRTHDS
jgi:1-deoxy-D-xylulose-5-phosphate synthase